MPPGIGYKSKKLNPNIDNAKVVRTLKNPDFKKMHMKTAGKLKEGARKIGLKF